MRILVGTHHKTGTVWMQKTFRQIAKTLGLDFVNLLRDPPPYRGDVLFHPHSGFDDTITAGDFRGLHLVRDPRDIAISALRYHRDSKELWLHEPRDEFGGVTYQEKLNSLSQDEQFLFDLRGSTSDTLRQILAWRYDDPRFFEATYEQLITDQRGEYFASIMRHLGFDSLSVAASTAVFLRCSIAGKPLPADHRHIRSGRPEQWKRGWRRWHGERFIEAFGDCLIRLRYEPDDGWVERLPLR
jgi:Sulfotransferase domain